MTTWAKESGINDNGDHSSQKTVDIQWWKIIIIKDSSRIKRTLQTYTGLRFFSFIYFYQTSTLKVGFKIAKEDPQNYFNKTRIGLQYNNFVISPLNYIKGVGFEKYQEQIHIFLFYAVRAEIFYRHVIARHMHINRDCLQENFCHCAA